MENEDEHGTGRTIATGALPRKTQGPTPNLRRWKIMFAVLLTASITLKLSLLLVLLQPVFQGSSSEMFDSAASFRSCELAHRTLTENLTLDPDTAHYQLVLSKDGKTAYRGNSAVNTLPVNIKRFDHHISVLTHKGFTSGKHCWRVDTGNGKFWGMGVARETVRRKGNFNISPEEGIWAIKVWDGEYHGLTSPTEVLCLRKVPNMIWVYLDYEEEKVAFFNAVTKDHIFTFPKASFSGERVFPWFEVWASDFHLTLLP